MAVFMNNDYEMSELERNIPDDFWRKAFEEAAETPPPRVWDAVERRLDDSESKGFGILPLWGAGHLSSRPVVWGMGMAAAVSLVMVGWWALQTSSPENSVAQTHTPNQTERVVAVPKTPSRMAKKPSVIGEIRPQSGETIASANKSVKVASKVRTATSIDRQSRLAKQSDDELLAQTTQERLRSIDVPTALGLSETRYTTKLPANVYQQSYVQNQPLVDALPQTQADALRSLSSSALPEAGQQQAKQTLAFNQLAALPMRLREPGAIQRIVWIRPADAATESAAEQSVKPKRDSREFWASASLMPGAFDPSVSIRPTQVGQASFANSSALNTAATGQQSVQSRANFSIAYQAGAGIQLNEHWSVESGVGYLVGQSTVESPARAGVNSIASIGNKSTEVAGNLYVDALQNSRHLASANSVQRANADYSNYTNSSQYLAQNNYNAQARQTLANNYRYVQMPVQIGYQLRPKKRLSLALLGGLLTNVFVRNTVDNDVVVTAKDGIYRPVSWAAIMGARFRYRPSRQWSASLAGTYQPSLGLGTRPESEVLSRPTSTGMSFGVDYHF